ncbi:hypothetical protein BGZ60DRAFT_418378 [Tricladium varicosporioides]|nr:hypothetical protein BGZ60DRAFT_418378 [Hymenoscyphus varicosporioides]
MRLTASNNGLQASRWAPSGNASSATSSRPGDWKCASCSFDNFASRKVCFACQNPKLPERGLPESSPLRKLNNTSIANTNTSRSSMYSSNTAQITNPPAPPHTINHAHPPLQSTSNSQPMHSPVADRFNAHKYGLSTSRWAPRNSVRNPQNGSPQIWTRTVSITKQKPQAYGPSTSSHTPDLGLPYEVQHFILATMERILEEACYDFASRWIPHILVSKGWTCPEAVELAKWKEALPEEVPLKSIVQVPNYTLEQGLLDAVRLRNSAVHRHLCDNAEIRRMSLKSQDLMFMFSDHTRQVKFQTLRAVLSEWDALNPQDPQGARARLEAALKEIGERPVNDMDWSPNSVSLEEVGHEEVIASGENRAPVGHGHVVSQYEYYEDDAMDMD